jgi:hypothetical protein
MLDSVVRVGVGVFIWQVGIKHFRQVLFFKESGFTMEG